MKLPCSHQVLLRQEAPLCCVAFSVGQEAGHRLKGSVHPGVVGLAKWLVCRARSCCCIFLAEVEVAKHASAA